MLLRTAGEQRMPARALLPCPRAMMKAAAAVVLAGVAEAAASGSSDRPSQLENAGEAGQLSAQMNTLMRTLTMMAMRRMARRMRTPALCARCPR